MPRKKTLVPAALRDKKSRVLLRNDELPASVGLVKHVRSEMKAESRSIRHAMVAMDKRIDGRFSQIDGHFSDIDGKIGCLDIKVGLVESTLSHKIDSVEKTLTIRMDGLETKIDSVEKRLTIRMDGLETKLDSVEKSLGGRFDAMDSRFDSMEQRLDRGFASMEEKMKSYFHGTQSVVEEQEGRNRMVLDSLKDVLDKQGAISTGLAKLGHDIESHSLRLSRLESER